MKYPVNQFETLVKCVSILANYIDLNSFNPSNLHYIIYQQFSEGQKHNRLVISNGELKRKFTLVNGELVENEGLPLFDFVADFELYPEGCNDSHIETAVKRAIKTVLKETV